MSRGRRWSVGGLILLGGLAAGCAHAPVPAYPAPQSGVQLPSLLSVESAGRMIQNGGVTVLDVRPDWADYLLNHLPGAAWLSIETLRSTENGLPFQLFSAESYASLLTRQGVREGRPVIIYSAGESRDIDATFVAWILAGLHQSQVYLLDGGYAKWATDGQPLARHYPSTVPGSFPVRPFEPEGASLAEVQRAVATRDAILVDARNPKQFSGGAGAQMRRGHIPGAINHPWQSDLEKRDLALVWKGPEDLRAGYTSQGITPDRSVIVYCNTSTEASHVHFALRYLLGYPKVRIYLGSWSQWAERDDLPIATGE